MWLGRYEVIRKLGAGGMARVLLARAPDGRRVVLKVPHDTDPSIAERLREEARVGLRLQHPNLVETVELFEHGGKPILALRYVPGASMQQLRKRTGPLPAGLVARLGRQVAEALAAIHEATDEDGRPLGILHRDVTPGNILVTRAGDAKLIDLGIAKGVESRVMPTAVGSIRGTMRYLAPELLRGAPHAPATDLWALGMVLFEAVLGRPAVVGDDRFVLASIIRGDIKELQPGEVIAPPLHEVLNALLAPAAERLQTARAAALVLSRVEQVLGDRSSVAAERVDRALGLLEGAPTEQMPAFKLPADALPAVAPAAAPPAAAPPIADPPTAVTREPAAAPPGLQHASLDDVLPEAADTVQMSAVELAARGLEPAAVPRHERDLEPPPAPLAPSPPPSSSPRPSPAPRLAISPASTEQLPAWELERLHAVPRRAPSLVEPLDESLAEPIAEQPAVQIVETPPPAPTPRLEAAPRSNPAAPRSAPDPAPLADDELAWKPRRGPWLLAAALGLVVLGGAIAALVLLG